MIFDSHVHIGQYFDDYYTPPRVCRTLRLVGVTHFAYSSTTAVVCDDPNILREERDAVKEFSEGCGVPFLWVAKSMLERSKDLKFYLDDEIRGLKVHGVSELWNPCGKELKRVFCIAQERKIPVLLHTGERDLCYAEMYRKVCEKFPEVPMILAHGRPLNQTLRMLESFPNVYVDTAFMPHEHLKILLNHGFCKRILFGSDTPIPSRFMKSSLTRYLRRRIKMTQKIAGNVANDVLYENASLLFKLNSDKTKK